MHIALRPFVFLAALWLLPPYRMTAQSEIKGSITTEKGEPASFVPLLLLDTLQGSKARYTLSDENGQYSIRGLKQGNYLLQVKALGFEDYKSNLQQVDGKRETVILLPFVLTPKSLQLREVSVSAQKALFRQTSDRLIYYVENSIASQGGDALDALKNTPLIKLDENNNTIAMIGKSQLRVMVNGRMLNLSGAELMAWLRATPNDNIASIEIITTPPARYDAEGNSGLLNIVLKKNPEEGFQGTISNATTQRTYLSNNSSLNLNHQSKKWTSTATAGYQYSKIKAFEGYDNRFDNGFSNLGSQNKNTESKDFSSNLNLSYKLNSKSDLALVYSLNQWSFLSSDKSYRDFAKDGTLLARLDNTGRGELKGIFQQAGLYATRQLDSSGKSAEIGMLHIWNEMSQNRVNQSTENGISETVKNLSENRYGIWIGSVDFNLPFKLVKVQAGSRLSIFENRSMLRFNTLMAGQEIQDPNRSNDFNFDEAISAAYFSAEKNLGSKWVVQGGLRYEYTSNNGSDNQNKKITRRRYGNFFPGFFFTFNAAENQSWTLRYSRRVNRPVMDQLNPFRWYINPASYVEGNPYLQPAFIHNLELSFSNNNNLSANIFYSITKSSAGYIPVFIADGSISYLTTLNALDVEQFGLYSNYVFTAIKGLQSEISGSFFKTSSSTRISDKVPSLEGYGASISLQNSVKIGSAHTLFLNLDQNLRTVQDNMKTEPYNFASAGYRLGLRQGKLRMALIFSALLSKNRKIAYTQFLPAGRAGGVNEYDYTSLRFSLSYRFGNEKVSSRTKEGPEEQNRIR
jgi:hypothetical protein